jgi:hypothetical protein
VFVDPAIFGLQAPVLSHPYVVAAGVLQLLLQLLLVNVPVFVDPAIFGLQSPELSHPYVIAAGALHSWLQLLLVYDPLTSVTQDP